MRRPAHTSWRRRFLAFTGVVAGALVLGTALGTVAACGGGGSDGGAGAEDAEEAFASFWSAAFAGDGDSACSLLLADLQESLLDVGPLFGVGGDADCTELVVAWGEDLRAANGGEEPDATLEDVEVLEPTGEIPEFVSEDFERFANGDAVVGDEPATPMQLVLIAGEWMIATPPGPFPGE